MTPFTQCYPAGKGLLGNQAKNKTDAQLRHDFKTWWFQMWSKTFRTKCKYRTDAGQDL